MKAIVIGANIAAIAALIASSAGSSAEPAGKRNYEVRVQGVSSDGVTIFPTPVPTPTPTPEPPVEAAVVWPVYREDVERWRGLVASIFPGWAVDTALRIMDCESKGLQNATGRAGERGLFQIHPIHHDSTYDPLGNVLAAYRISSGGADWSAWSCS